MKIGILAMQGAFREHEQMLKSLGVETAQVRKSTDLDDIDGLVIPGGESTTIGKLLVEFGLGDIIQAKAKQGMPIFGTCAGMILLAKDIIGSDQFRLGLMDIEVNRNAFGRQVDSFETGVRIDALGDQLFPAVFIRAPYVTAIKPNVGVLATLEDKMVFVRQGNFLASAFHPELTGDGRVHQYFLNMVRDNKQN